MYQKRYIQKHLLGSADANVTGLFHNRAFLRAVFRNSPYDHFRVAEINQIGECRYL